MDLRAGSLAFGTRPLSAGPPLAIVTIRYTGKGSRPWAVMWKSPHQFQYQCFETRVDAVEAAQQISIEDGTFDCDQTVHAAKLPYSINVPSTPTLEVWIDVADELFAAVLAARSAKN